MENEILDYVMETPGNTNPAILRQMLQKNSNGGTMELFIIEYDFSYTDKTFNEIKEAFLSGKICMFHWLSGENGGNLTEDNYYAVTGIVDSSLTVYYGSNGYFYASDPDDYLVMPD